jgi:photosystem II stability/assembly factor-like uncharacterized protein
MWSTTRTLYDFLSAHHFDSNNIWLRESDTGHELYGWHYEEAFAWMDRGERKAKGTVAAGWTAESLPAPASITALTQDGNGAVYATGTGGIFHRSGDGTWTQRLTLGGNALPPHLDDICFLADGSGIAVGETHRYVSTDGTTWTAGATIPEEYVDQGFGGAYVNTLACNGSNITATGLWTGAHSSDGGMTWSKANVDSGGGPAFATLVRRSATGTFVAAGYWNYLARSTDGITFTMSTIEASIQWWNAVAPDGQGAWWAVGEKGTVLRSTDDGVSFHPSTVPTQEDLYAVAFRDAQNGIVAGAHGAVLGTHDAGNTWSDLSTGLDGYVGAISWLPGNTVLVAGEQGTVLRRVW